MINAYFRRQGAPSGGWGWGGANYAQCNCRLSVTAATPSDAVHSSEGQGRVVLIIAREILTTLPAACVNFVACVRACVQKYWHACVRERERRFACPDPIYFHLKIQTTNTCFLKI